MAREKPVGWRKESARHGLAAKGVKTKWYPFLSERMLHRQIDEAAERSGMLPFKHIPTMSHFPEAIPVIRDHSDDKKEAERMATKLYKETGRMAYIVWRPQQAKKGSRAGYLVLDPKPWADSR